MIAKTEALALRVTPFSETSQVVTWLTLDRGRITTLVKGARRPKSPFLGQYDLYYTCELLFYERARNDLHIAKECCPLNPRPQFRTDWRAAACASYLCDLAARVSPAGGHEPEIYGLLSRSLDALCERGACLSLIFWFELAIAGILGLSPRLEHCAGCGKPASRNRSADFSPVRGGILCSRCAGETERQALYRVSPSGLGILRGWQSAQHPRAAYNTRCPDHLLLVFREMFARFTGYHLDLSPESRATATAIVTWDSSA